MFASIRALALGFLRGLHPGHGAAGPNRRRSCRKPRRTRIPSRRSGARGGLLCAVLCVLGSVLQGQSIAWTRQWNLGRPYGVFHPAVVAAGGVFVAGTVPPGGRMKGIHAVVRKYDANGIEAWNAQFGPSSTDRLTSIAAYGSFVYVGGVTRGAFGSQTNAGADDGFVRKYSSTGNEVWTRQFGSSGLDLVQGVAADASGVYVAGTTNGSLGAWQNQGGTDAFLVKYDRDGNKVWTRQFGTSVADEARSIAVNNAGIYVAGVTNGVLPGSAGSSGGRDAFVRMFDLRGRRVLWTRQFGTSGADEAWGVALDRSGVYVVGSTTGRFAGQKGAGGQDAFVCKYRLDGTSFWTWQFGTRGSDEAQGVAADGSGVYVAGSTDASFGRFGKNLGQKDAFVVKFAAATGHGVWTKQFGTAMSEGATSISVDASGVYAAGVTSGDLANPTSTGGKTVFYDFVVKIAENLPPVANIAVTQLTAIGTNAAISLDGTGSSDPDDAFADLTFKWTVDSVVVCNGTAAQCATYEAHLPIDIALGSHQVTLRVTDPDGAYDETSTTVVVNPAELSVLKIEEAEVEFDPGEREVEVSGDIGLPFGTTFSELLPRIRTTLAVAGKAVVAAADLSFTAKGGEKKEWKFENKAAATGISKFQIDWKGSRYRFHAKGFPVELKSKLITTTETTLEVKVEAKKIPSAFTLSIGTLGTVSFDRDGRVTSSTVPYKAKGKKVTLTLAGPLQATTAISFTGGLSRVVHVGADLKASVGRFHLHAKFDGALLPRGASTTPRTLDLRVQVGRQGYSGSASLTSTQLALEGSEWEFEEDDG